MTQKIDCDEPFDRVKLTELIEEAKRRPKMTREEREEQARSWVRGEMGIGAND